MSAYRYFTRVHASNRHAGYGIPVVVIAQNWREAVTRAVDAGWGERREDARVTMDRVEDVSSDLCTCCTQRAKEGVASS